MTYNCVGAALFSLRDYPPNAVCSPRTLAKSSRSSAIWKTRSIRFAGCRKRLWAVVSYHRRSYDWTAQSRENHMAANYRDGRPHAGAWHRPRRSPCPPQVESWPLTSSFSKTYRGGAPSSHDEGLCIVSNSIRAPGERPPSTLLRAPRGLHQYILHRVLRRNMEYGPRDVTGAFASGHSRRGQNYGQRSWSAGRVGGKVRMPP